MAQKLIYNKRKSHSDDDNDFLPEPGNGVDNHTFTISGDKQFDRYELALLSPAGSTGCAVRSKPRRGANGRLKIKVRYHYLPFAKVSYRLKVFSKPKNDSSKSELQIAFGKGRWKDKVQDAVNQNLKFKIVVKGEEAKELGRLLAQSASLHEEHVVSELKPPHELYLEEDTLSEDVILSEDDAAPKGGQSPAPAAEAATAIAITTAVVFGLAATATFGIFAAVLLYAINRQYSIDAHYKYDPLEVVFVLVPEAAADDQDSAPSDAITKAA